MILAYAKQLKQEKYPAGKTRGACLEAASHLFEHFYALGVNCSVQFGYYGEQIPQNEHAWFEYWDEQQGCVIVDITADQFDPAQDIVFDRAENLPHYSYDSR